MARFPVRCNGEGYESVALIPLGSNGATVGLLQLNDHRAGMFTAEFVALCERLAASIGIALARKQAEQGLHGALSTLEGCNQELQAFTYSVAHDLRAPLRAIDGFSAALEEEYGDKLNARGNDYLSRVRTSTNRMRCPLDELLRLSWLSQVAMSPEKIDLSAVAVEIAAELRRDEPDREVNLVIEPRPDHETPLTYAGREIAEVPIGPATSCPYAVIQVTISRRSEPLVPAERQRFPG